MSNLILIRGLPGSGKSTFARLISPYICEADQFFVDEEGIYRFDASRIQEAHVRCLDQCDIYMLAQHPMIAVSNTFVKDRELQPYYDLATKNGYTVTSIIVENRHGSDSIHDVPSDVIQRMQSNFSIRL